MNPALITSSLNIKYLEENDFYAFTTLWVICYDRSNVNLMSKEKRETLEKFGLIDHYGYPIKEAEQIILSSYPSKILNELWKRNVNGTLHFLDK